MASATYCNHDHMGFVCCDVKLGSAPLVAVLPWTLARQGLCGSRRHLPGVMAKFAGRLIASDVQLKSYVADPF